jgi:hypothetical protein
LRGLDSAVERVMVEIVAATVEQVATTMVEMVVTMIEQVLVTAMV